MDTFRNMQEADINDQYIIFIDAMVAIYCKRTPRYYSKLNYRELPDFKDVEPVNILNNIPAPVPVQQNVIATFNLPGTQFMIL